MKFVLKRFCQLAALSSFVFMASCGGSGGSSAASKKWTYMVYLGADNTLSDAGLADLAEMETVGSSADVNIVVQAEFEGTNTLRFLVNQDSDASAPNLDAGTSQGNLDMGTPQTLTDFITWASTNYPADHYALVIWDHGAGWKNRNPALTRGAVEDQTSGSFMSLTDLGSAVSNAGVHLDVLNFDACLMGMYEVAYQFAGQADYLVASEETEPGDGNPYNTLLAALAANPDMTGRELAIQTVDSYNAFYTDQSRDTTTLAAYDMSQLTELDSRVRALGVAMQADDANNAVFTAAETNTQVYEEAANHDLQHLAQYLVDHLADGDTKTAAQNVIDFIPSFVIENKITGDSVTNSNGVAIYMPTTAQTSTSDLTQYAALACNLARSSDASSWGGFVEDIVEENGGATLSEASGDFAVRVDWDCDADVDLYIGEPNGSADPGELNAPWMGSTTENGFFSGDSADTGENSESYQANDTVVSGDYFILINYYANGTSCTSTEARVYIRDAANGFTDFTEVTTANGFTTTAESPRTLSLTDAWDGSDFTDPLDLNDTSDWWVPFSTTRAVGSATYNAPEIFDAASKSTRNILRYKKTSRIFY